MAQFAFYKPFEGWEQITPSGQFHKINVQEYIKLDADKLTSSEVAELKAKKVFMLCPVCEERMFFNKGFLKSDGNRLSNKNPYFWHYSRKTCHFSESLPHALTKRFLFSKLREAGYDVREEYRHIVNGKRVRADVAAFTGESETRSLRLVVEVQASNGNLASISKKINSYYLEQVPTAWVILLDDFFTGYTGITNSTYNPLTGAYELHPIEPGEENYFVVIGKDSKTFTFLMNEYGYILAINYAGQVFLIRRDPVNEPRRISAILHKQHWTPQDDVYKITRIADKDIVPTLQLTPLLSVHQVEEVTFFGVPLGSHDGTGKHAIDTADENDFISELVDTNDQFQIEELLGSEADKALNPLYLILETWSAQREATKKLTQQLDEEQRFLEEEEQKRRISELLPTSSTGSVMLQEKEHDNITHSHPDIAEPNEMENLLTEEHSTILSINRRPTNKVLDEIVHSLPLYGIKLLDPMDIYGLNEKEASLFLEYIYGQSKHYPSIDIFRNEETIWNSYVTLPQEKRHLLERNVFPEGLPAWFMEKKFPFDRKQIEIQKKETMKLKKNSKQKDNVQPSWEEQMGFDY